MVINNTNSFSIFRVKTVNGSTNSDDRHTDPYLQEKSLSRSRHENELWSPRNKIHYCSRWKGSLPRNTDHTIERFFFLNLKDNLIFELSVIYIKLGSNTILIPDILLYLLLSSLTFIKYVVSRSHLKY